MDSSDEEYQDMPTHTQNGGFDNDDDDDDIEIQDGDQDGYGGANQNDDDDDLDDDERDGDEGQNITAWGTEKKRFYRQGDEQVSDNDEAEEEEEEEAKLIEKLQNEQLTHENFFDVFGEQTGAQEKQGIDDEDDEGEDKKAVGLKARLKSMEHLAENEKIAVIQKESPELFNIINEYKTSLKEIKYKFMPLINYYKTKKGESREGQRYLEIKFNLLMSYCMNLSFYILLNIQGKSVKDHPVIKKLISLKTQLARLKPLDKKLQPEIHQILKTIEKEKSLNEKTAKKSTEKKQNEVAAQNPNASQRQEKNLFGDSKKGKKQQKEGKLAQDTNKKETAKSAKVSEKEGLKKALKGELEIPEIKTQELLTKRSRKELMKAPKDLDDDIDDDIGDDDDDDLDGGLYGGFGEDDEDEGGLEEEDDYYNQVKAVKKIKREKINKEKEQNHLKAFKEKPYHFVGEEDARTINKKIFRNKGLVRRRPKEQRNSRIKLKNKYQAAMHKQKSKGNFVRDKEDYYGGEVSGVKAGLIRSTKLTYQ